jgi:hypothetical protein
MNRSYASESTVKLTARLLVARRPSSGSSCDLEESEDPEDVDQDHQHESGPTLNVFPG